MPGKPRKRTRLKASRGSLASAQSLGEIVERCARAAARKALYIVRSPAEAEDIAQETLLRVFRRPLRDPEEFVRYALKTATNLALNRLRFERLAARKEPSLTVHFDDAGDPERTYGDRAFVRALLDRCSDAEAQTWLLHHLDGLSQKEVATALGVTRRTVYNRLVRVEAAARELLKPGRPEQPPR